MPSMLRRWLFLLLVCALAPALWPDGPMAQQPPKAKTLDTLLDNLIHPQAPVRYEAMAKLTKMADRSAIPALIELLRFGSIQEFEELNIPALLEPLSGQKFGDNWGKWVEWLAQQQDLRPHAGFIKWKTALLSLIDPNFAEFLHPGVKHRVRIEEIVWGGVVKDGIPALTNPRHVKPAEATYLTPDELVLGLSLKGHHRAYPLRIMDWHEMANDVIAGTPVTISY